MPKGIDPFDFVITFRDQLESHGPEAALAKLQPKGPGAPDPRAQPGGLVPHGYLIFERAIAPCDYLCGWARIGNLIRGTL